MRVLALDLERTLIDDARSGRPRPELFEFTSFCAERFERIVLFTTVEREDAFEVLESLKSHLADGFLERIEYVEWTGEYKDLAFVPDAKPEEVRLVDDDEGWIRPDQRPFWIPIIGWDGGDDAELSRVRAALERWFDESGDVRLG